MRWNALFSDLESQLTFERWQGVEAEAAEMTRGIRAGVTLVQRIRGQMGQQIRLLLDGGDVVQLQVATASPQWVGGSDVNGSLLIPWSAVAGVDALMMRPAAEELVRVGATITAAYRSLSRRREAVVIQGRGGAVLAEGTIDRVGADHFDVSMHARDEMRGPRSVRGVRAIRFDAIAVVRSAHRL